MFGVVLELTTVTLAVAWLTRRACSSRSSGVRRALLWLAVVYVGLNAAWVCLACGGPTGAGYNVVTGEGAFRLAGEAPRPGRFGPTWQNLFLGLNPGFAVAVLGAAPAGLAWCVRRPRRWVASRVRQLVAR